MTEPRKMIPFDLHRMKMEELQAKQQERLAQQRRNLFAQFQKRQGDFIEQGKRAGTLAYVAATAARFMRPGDVVIDCGANIGSFTDSFARTPARVIAFEPNPDCTAFMRSRFADRPNVVIEEAAVGAAAGEADLYYHGHYTSDVANDKSSEGSSIEPSMARLLTGKSHRVPVIDIVARMQELLAEGANIAILKLDIEGSELEVLERLFELDLFARITMSLVETHERNFPDRAERFGAIRARIAGRYDPMHVFLDWV
ncbi:FkbM family methyltransferase [Oceaniglobus roseus]|uniref:FkbM family methyltransferase n=1 Tax=Oceaniglobus roseus TaxID=1737570 RepID=UPI001C12A658|nr:FkbM family methyltransferase [Kandeliimicrobium roseum]